MADPLELEGLVRKYGRRDFLKTLGAATCGGLVAGGLTHAALGKGMEYLGEFVDSISSNMQEFVQDMVALRGTLENEISRHAEVLQNQYESGRLEYLRELNLVSAQEMETFERLIENLENIEDHYGLSERLRIFKGRVDDRLSRIDAYIEEEWWSKVPGLDKLNDGVRSLFGKPTGEDGRLYRQQIRNRMHYLAQVYEINWENKKAQEVVADQITDWLDDNHLSRDERELLGLLKENYVDTGNPDGLREFIMNYDSRGNMYVEREKLEALQSGIRSLEETISVYKEDVFILEQLQESYQRGISLKQELRSQTPEEVDFYRDAYKTQLEELEQSVSGVIEKITEKGYITPEEPPSSAIQARLSPVRNGISIGMAILGGLYAGMKRFSKRKERAYYQAGKELESAYNRLVEERNET
ncbi:MAG: twin-arginine translocation signal domain-containing protein [Candidatus Woesearchaeota archaeon]